MEILALPPMMLNKVEVQINLKRAPPLHRTQMINLLHQAHLVAGV